MSVHVSSGVGSTPIPPIRSSFPEAAQARAGSLPRPERLQAIDAARGIAMILVCVSHVRVHFADTLPTFYFVLTSITRVATPTFLLLSGFVAAYVLANGSRRARLTLVDRGLFVLLAGHFLLGLNELQTLDLEQWIFGRVTITDAIGICLICAAALYRLPALALAMLGLTLGLMSWPIAMTQTFEAPLARHLGAALFDLQSEANAIIDAAIAPYLGMFVIGMAFSKTSFGHLTSGDTRPVATKLARAGVIGIVIVTIAAMSWFALKRLDLTPADPSIYELVRRGVDPRSKLPPSPAYLLFYGGCGLLLTAWCLSAKPRLLMRPLIEWASTIGRASLMCFILQDWLLKLIPSVLRFDDVTNVLFWIAYFICAVAIMHWAASRWDANRANRFLTIGLKNMGAEALTEPSSATPPRTSTTHRRSLLRRGHPRR